VLKPWTVRGHNSNPSIYIYIDEYHKLIINIQHGHSPSIQ
jgi:hypothetical protein